MKKKCIYLFVFSCIGVGFSFSQNLSLEVASGAVVPLMAPDTTGNVPYKTGQRRASFMA